jgi:hypothetical protein
VSPAALVLLLLAAAPSDEGAADEACDEVAEIARPARVPPLERRPRWVTSRDLLAEFGEGVGTLTVPASAKAEPERPLERDLANGVAVTCAPLPWRMNSPERSARACLATWPGEARFHGESMRGLLLRRGERWCSPSAPAGARLRFEAVRPRVAPAVLAVTLGARTQRFQVEGPGALESATQVDLDVAAPAGPLCFAAEAGDVIVGEPRLLRPRGPEDERRPPWIVLVVIDTLRADALTMLPAVRALAETGLSADAVSPGCHTKAALHGLLSGRDPERLDPLVRREDTSFPSAELQYARGAVPIGQLLEAGGYHAVFLGNNGYLTNDPMFARFSSWGAPVTGTVDTALRLPELFRRYGDESVLLVHWISAPHAFASTPRYAFDELGCGAMRGSARCVCHYHARARHADDGVDALLSGLESAGLAGEAMVVVTGDHGETIDDQDGASRSPTGRTMERTGHGAACGEPEVVVPLVMVGPGIARQRVGGRVSTLDVVPTILARAGLSAPVKLDGTSLLDPRNASAAADERRVLPSYGFCRYSIVRGPWQYLWTTPECRKDGVPLELLLRDGREVSAPEELAELRTLRSTRARELRPGDAIVLDVSQAGDVDLVVAAEGGRIIDFAPTSSVLGLDRLELVLETKGRLRVKSRGFRGRLALRTEPARAAIRLESAGTRPLVLIGRLQLPLSDDVSLIDPARRFDLLLAPASTIVRRGQRPRIGLWWQSSELGSRRTVDRGPSDIDGVLREWGYVR